MTIEGQHGRIQKARRCWSIVAALGLTLLVATPSAAQIYRADQDKGPDTRQELRSRLQQLEQTLAENPRGDAGRDARERIEAIERRLERGDFQLGDVVQLTVRSDSSLTGTFRVNQQRELELPTIPDVELAGVLYAEADSVIRSYLSEYLRNPEIRVQVTRRIAVLGAVQQPGFYDLAPTTTLSDVLMAAGGPTGEARLEDIELRRNGKDVLEGRSPNLQTTTLAQLGPSQDDQLVVPQAGGGFGPMDALGVISGVSGAVWAVTRIF